MRHRYRDLLGTLAACLYSLPAWAYPFGNDQALHWYLGWRWLHGTPPFVSGISSKPVGIFATHALSTALFGGGQWAIRVTETLTVVAAGWLAALAARGRASPLRDGELGLGALLMSAGYYTFFDYWDSAHPELWEGTFALAALVVAQRAAAPWKRDAGAGALVMASFMYKFPAGVIGLGVAAVCAARAVQERPHGQHALLALVFAGLRFLLGALPVVVLCTLPFALTGTLGPMWEILYDFILRYREQATREPGLPAWLHLEEGGGFPAIALALLAVGLAVARERGDGAALRRGSWLLAMLLLAVASVAAQGRYFNYHWVVTAPFLTALAMFGLGLLSRRESSLGWPMLAASAASVVLVYYAEPRWDSGPFLRTRERSVPTHSYRAHTNALLAMARGELPRQGFLQAFRGPRPFDGTAPLERIADHVNRLKAPGDTLCTRGFLTPLYPLTKLTCPSRHIVQEIVESGLPGWPREYRRALETHPPTFIVTFADRPRDMADLRKRGYRQAANESKIVLMTLKANGAAAPESPATGAAAPLKQP